MTRSLILLALALFLTGVDAHDPDERQHWSKMEILQRQQAAQLRQMKAEQAFEMQRQRLHRMMERHREVRELNSAYRR